MALVVADRVQETTTTTGTGTITLAGAVSGFQTFATIGNGNTTYYCVTSGTAWEVGIGTYTSSGTTLARTTILASSAAGAAITLAGTSNVFCVYPAGKSVYQDADGNIGLGVTSAAFPITIYRSGTPANIQATSDSASTTVQARVFSNTTSNCPIINLARSRGTLAASTIVSSGDPTGNLSARGWDGVQFIQTGAIDFAVDGTPGVNDMPGRIIFSTTADGAASPTERMRIDSAGNVGLGGAAPVGSNFYNSKSITGATTAGANNTVATIQSDVTTARGYTSTLSTAAAVFSTGIQHFIAGQSSIGAGSTVTAQTGFWASSSMVGATTNYGFVADNTAAVTAGKSAYGFFSNVNTATGGGTTWGFYAAGTTNNFFQGNVGIGTGKAVPSTALDVNGTVTATGGAFTTLSASSTVSGAGFSTYLASPPAIGGTVAAAITGTTITATTAFSGPLNGTVGATTPSTGEFTTLSASTSLAAGGVPVPGYSLTVRSTALANAYFVDTDSGTGGMNINFLKNSASPAASDDIANLRFYGNDSAAVQTEYVRLAATIADPTNGSEDGTLVLNTIKAGTVAERVRYSSADGLYVVDGAFRCPDAYASTTGTAANMVMSSASGILQRSTSSLRYKNSVTDATYGLAEVMQLRPVTYKGNNDGDTVFGGFIAEEVHGIGLTQFVQYDAENRPDALAYGNMVSLLAKAMQEQQAMIEDLKARIAVLEAR